MINTQGKKTRRPKCTQPSKANDKNLIRKRTETKGIKKTNMEKEKKSNGQINKLEKQILQTMDNKRIKTYNEIKQNEKKTSPTLILRPKGMKKKTPCQ